MGGAALVIRQATPADARTLASLRYEFRAGLDRAAEAEGAFIDRCAAWMAPRLAAASAWRCWVAEKEGTILGHLWLELVEKIPNPVAEPELHAYVTNVYVRPAARRQGLGGLLLSAALECCRGQHVDSMILWPSAESRSLYARFGFRDSGDLWEAPVEPSEP